jgi:ATP-binding cassette subfamily B protein
MILNNKAFHILYSLFKPHKKLLAIYLAALIIYSILDVFRISLIYPIINYGLDVNTSSTVIDTFFQSILPQNLNPFVASALLLGIITLVIAIVEIGVAYLGSKTFSTPNLTIVNMNISTKALWSLKIVSILCKIFVCI